jgi:16S rRNA (uracil1498-N3)-methyltransferase
MHRHYLEPARFPQTALELDRDEARHLQTVLRVRDGELVELFDGQGRTARALVTVTGRHGLHLALAAPPTCHAPPACQLLLFACVSKGKRMDWTIEKSVELGVSRIIPVLSERTIVRLDEEGADGKADRWLRVAVEAARQSGAVWLPTMDVPQSLPAALPVVRACAPVFVAALTPTAQPLRQVLAGLRAPHPPPATVGWFVGPEGDFTPDELRLLLEAGAIPVSCGRQVLRTETAAIWGLCVLGAEFL